MGFGVRIPNTRRMASPDYIHEFSQTAEELGFDGLWAVDHVVMPQHTDSFWHELNRGGSLHLRSRLDAREREQLHRDGYVVRDGVFHSSELQRIRSDCEALVERSRCAVRTGTMIRAK